MCFKNTLKEIAVDLFSLFIGSNNKEQLRRGELYLIVILVGIVIIMVA